jgi:hypothetical protein
MNSALVHKSTRAAGQTVLARLLREERTDDEIVTALYRRVLARKPTKNELAVCKRYIVKVGDRREALEDVLWGLVNSTEFLIKK